MFFLEYINSIFTFDCMCCKEQPRTPQIYYIKKSNRPNRPVFRRIRKL